MKRSLYRILATLVFLLSGTVSCTQVTSFYVSPRGNDAWTGKFASPRLDGRDGPFATIARAQQAAREAKRAGLDRPIDVVVAEGEYRLREPLTFGPEDSGTEACPVRYRGKGNVVVSGGTPITRWRETTLNGKTVWAVDLPEVKSGQWNFHQLIVNGERRFRPRLPKQGVYRFTGSPLFKKRTPYNTPYDRANFEPGHIRNWQNVNDVEVVVLHFWVAPRMRIQSVDEAANLVVFTAKTIRRLTNSFDESKFARYYVENVKEALTEPGEWYLDRTEGTLYYMPMPGEKPETVRVVAPRLPSLLVVQGKGGKDEQPQYLSFSNFHFENTEWYPANTNPGDQQAAESVPGAVSFANANHCEIRDCTIQHHTTYGVEVAGGCRNITIENNVISDLGAGGVKMGHGSGFTRLVNNEISNAGLIFHNAVGVWIGQSSDNLVAHNDIHHLFYTGVSVGWSWGYAPTSAARNIIEYNRIHDIGQGFLSDMAGVYTLGVSPGTCVRNNVIHDIAADDYGGWGLYTDEGSTGIVMENNVVYRTTHGGYHQHFGKDNLIRNNILAFGKNHQVARTREEEHNAFTFEHNIVYFDMDKLLGGKWTNNRYVMDNNLYWRTCGESFKIDGGSLADWQKRGHDAHSIVADPLFVDPGKDNYTLKINSPAKKIGFVPIDVSQAGRIAK